LRSARKRAASGPSAFGAVVPEDRAVLPVLRDAMAVKKKLE